jgi:hypothetical protein
MADGSVQRGVCMQYVGDAFLVVGVLIKCRCVVVCVYGCVCCVLLGCEQQRPLPLLRSAQATPPLLQRCLMRLSL